VRLTSLTHDNSKFPLSPMYVPYPPRAPPRPTWITYNNGRVECSASDGIRIAVPPLGNLCELTLEQLSAGGNNKRENFDESAQARVPPCISECRFLVSPCFGYSANGEEDSRMTRPVPTGPANFIQAPVSNDVITTVKHGASNARFCAQALVSNDVITTVNPARRTNACPTDATRRWSDERYATSRPDECYATSCPTYPTYSPRRFLSLSLFLSSLTPPRPNFTD
jgi:hypothetical protein